MSRRLMPLRAASWSSVHERSARRRRTVSAIGRATRSCACWTCPCECIILHYMVQHSSVSAATWAVVGGRGARDAGAPLNVPPILASTFALGGERAYSRDDATPTWEAFEEVLGGLEHGQAVAFASGMASIAAIFDLLPVGAEIENRGDRGHPGREGDRLPVL